MAKKKSAMKKKKNKKENKKSKKNKKKKATVKKTKRRSSRKPTVAIRKRSPPLVSLDAATGPKRRGPGARSAGQSGDIQGLSGAAGADSESVEELLEEGQAFEAGVVSGVEDAEAGQGEVRTKEVLEDDVPLEYLEKD